MAKNNVKDDRYERQAKLKELSETGNFQALLSKKTVAVIGLGGIGCMSAQLLARFGVGNLILVDKDKVELNNLHRQVLYKESDVGKFKANLATSKLKKINPSINLIPLVLNAGKKNILKIKADLILDCTDNLETKLIINEHCKKTKIPWVFATAVGTKVMVCSLISEKNKAWFEKSFGGKSGYIDSCSEGVLNTACNAAACIQATEAIKILTGTCAKPQLICFDIWKNEFEKIEI